MAETLRDFGLQGTNTVSVDRSARKSPLQLYPFIRYGRDLGHTRTRHVRRGRVCTVHSLRLSVSASVTSVSLTHGVTRLGSRGNIDALRTLSRPR